MKCTACTTHTTQILSNCTKNPIIVLKLDQLQANSHLELNLTGTSNINGKEKVGLICRLDSFVRKNKYIQKKNLIFFHCQL